MSTALHPTADDNPPGGVTEAQIAERLAPALGEAIRWRILNESHLHHGHAGATQGSHWRIVARGAGLAGMSPVARHRLVYDALKPLFDEGLHALAIDARPDGAL